MALPPTENLAKLIAIMERLRSPGGCPWDHEQDHVTLKSYLLEEAYEVLEAIDSGNPEELKEELGDLLLQVVFHAQIASENHQFTIEDVARSIVDKLVRRHPHVFGDVIVNGAEEVLKNWDEIKKAEKAGKGKLEKSVLEGVPKSLPALFEAFKISKKAAKLGFDWQHPQDVIPKIAEEVAEVQAALTKQDEKQLQEELGDLLFAVVNLCRLNGMNPEMALHEANQKFRKRFALMEIELQKKQKDPKSLDHKDWDVLWKRAKQGTKIK